VDKIPSNFDTLFAVSL